MPMTAESSRSRPDWTTRVIVVCAVMVTGLALSREVRAWRAPVTTRPGTRTEAPRVDQWQTLTAAGQRVGAPDAPIVIVEYADLECPVCRRFAETLTAIREQYRDTVALVFVHYPLPRHAKAIPAARAAECAGEQGRFGQFVDVAYRGQDSLGVTPWWRMAAAAGVSDSARFGRCMDVTAVPERVQQGLAQGKTLEVTGTPTILVNGWRFNGALPKTALDSVIRLVLAGKSPHG